MAKAPFVPWSTSDELMSAFAEASKQRLNPICLERFMTAILQVPAPVPASGQLQLEPLWNWLRRWQSSHPQPHLYRLPQRSLHLVLLAYGWSHQGQNPDFHEASTPYRAQQLQSPLSFCLMQQVERSLRYLREGRTTLLASPDHSDGWLSSPSLTKRIREHAPLGIDTDDLGLALLRLSPRGRRDLWRNLTLPADPITAAALQIALAPPQLAREGLVLLLAKISKIPPDDWLLQARHYTVQPRDTAPNRLFRLFARAIACRFGRQNAAQAWPILKQMPLDQLLINAGVDYSQWQETSVRMMENLSQLLRQGHQSIWQSAELELPEVPQQILRLGSLPQRNTLIEAFWHPDAELKPPFSQDPRMADILEPLVLPYPHMAAHVVNWLEEQHQPGHGLSFDTDEWVQPLVWYQPSLAPKLWQTGIRVLSQIPLGQSPPRFSFAIALLALGERPEIEVEVRDISAILRALTSRYRAHRQQGCRILHAVLASQRIEERVIAEAWTDLLCSENEPWSQVRQAFQDWLTMGPKAEAVLLHSYSQLWENGRVLSLSRQRSVLKHWQTLLSRHNTPLHLNPALKKALTQWAQSKKKDLAQAAQAILMQAKNRDS